MGKIRNITIGVFVVLFAVGTYTIINDKNEVNIYQFNSTNDSTVFIFSDVKSWELLENNTPLQVQHTYIGVAADAYTNQLLIINRTEYKPNIFIVQIDRFTNNKEKNYIDTTLMLYNVSGLGFNFTLGENGSIGVQFDEDYINPYNLTQIGEYFKFHVETLAEQQAIMNQNQTGELQ